jgi:metallo-beta-lactamase class B
VVQPGNLTIHLRSMICTLMRIVPLAVLISVLAVVPMAQQTSDERAAWNRPFQPFHLIGNIYYVGATGVSAFLIVTPGGSFLLDGGLPETAPQIARNVAELGFRLSDVKYLLNSHAHFDHAGGLAELKRLSGATMVASTGDAPALRAGGPAMPAVSVDRIVGDGEALRLGDTTLTAHVTPGHTQGCTTWTMQRLKRTVLTVSSSTAAPLSSTGSSATRSIRKSQRITSTASGNYVRSPATCF